MNKNHGTVCKIVKDISQLTYSVVLGSCIPLSDLVNQCEYSMPVVDDVHYYFRYV